MPTHKYKCHGGKSMQPAIWEGEIQSVRACRTTTEADVQARGSCFRIIIGHCNTGNFLCVPNWNIGMELAGFDDCFWTLEKLTSNYPRLNMVDAISITYAVAAIAAISRL